MNELLEKVGHDLGFACDGLRDALGKAGAVQSGVLLTLMWQASEAKRRVEQFASAVKADEKKGMKE